MLVKVKRFKKLPGRWVEEMRPLMGSVINVEPHKVKGYYYVTVSKKKETVWYNCPAWVLKEEDSVIVKPKESNE